MPDYFHDEWCSIYLDRAPESDCDCVRRILIRLEAEAAVAKMRLNAAYNAIDAVLRIDYGDFYETRTYRDAVHEALSPMKKLTASEIVQAIGITEDEIKVARNAIEETQQEDQTE